jgi:hypothetical protein
MYIDESMRWMHGVVGLFLPVHRRPGQKLQKCKNEICPDPELNFE